MMIFIKTNMVGMHKDFLIIKILFVFSNLDSLPTNTSQDNRGSDESNTMPCKSLGWPLISLFLSLTCHPSYLKNYILMVITELKKMEGKPLPFKRF